MKNKKLIAVLTLLCFLFTLMPAGMVFATNELPKYPVQIFTTAGGAGTTTSDGGSVSGGGDYNAGATVELTATLNEGFCAVGWAARGNEGAVIDDVTVPSDISPEHKTISFTMPAHEVEITADFRAHDYEYSYRDNEDGTHTNVCRYCKIENGVAEKHIDAHGGGDGTTPSDGYCDKCSADLRGTYTLTFDYSDTTDDGIIVGNAIANKTVEAKKGEVIDLSEYWPHELTYDLGGTTYYFAGFTKKDDISVINSVTVNGNIELEAVWTKDELITVTFETQGGDLFGGTRKSRVNNGYSFEKLNGYYIPTLEDSVFKGWCLKNVGLPEADDIVLTEDTTVYAIWQWNKQPEHAWWSETDKGKAMWTPVDDIDGYIVTLYEAESGSRIRSKVVSNDVSEYTFDNPVIFDENKNFYFTVMACLENLKSYETKSNESNPFAATVFDGATDSAVKVVKADEEPISVPVKVIGQGGSRVALTDDVFAFIGKKIDVSVANADKLAISKTAIKANLGITDENAEITLEEAKIILADWRVIVNTAEGEEQIKSLLPDYSIYELALLIQANNIIGSDDDTERKLNRLINDERERQKEAAANTQISFGETKVAMDAEALLSIEKALANGEYVAISAKEIDVTGLADDKVLFDSGVLTGSVIFTEQELLDLKVIEEDNDDITWNELKYLYHYMTITELKSLGWFIEDFLYNTDPQVLVWLAEMIERDTIKPLNMQELMDMADLTDEQWELLADADLNDPPIGYLRQAGLTVEQMRKLYGEVRILIGELNDSDKLSNCNELLGWLDDAIAAKEWEADMSQTQPSWAYIAKETVIGGVNINFDAVKVKGTTEAISETRPITANGNLKYTIAVDAAYVPVDRATTLRAYKVADNGSLINKTLLAMRNGENWMLTIESDSNSTYIVTVEDGYEITLNYGDGTISTVQTDKDGKLAVLPTPTRSGYTFLGWYDGSGNKITNGAVFTGAAEITAQWLYNGSGSGSGSGGGFSGSYNYPVVVADTDDAAVTLSDNYAVDGETVTITVTPEAGKQVDEVIVTDEDGEVIPVTKTGDNKYSFTMPKGKVNVSVTTEDMDYDTKVVLQINNKNVVVNNKTIVNDVAPLLMGDRTLVPIRVIIEALGGTVDWNEATRTVTITIDGKVLTLVIDEPIPGFGQGAAIMDNRTYVPIRYVAEYVGAYVEWIAESQQIVILK